MKRPSHELLGTIRNRTAWEEHLRDYLRYRGYIRVYDADNRVIASSAEFKAPISRVELTGRGKRLQQQAQSQPSGDPDKMCPMPGCLDSIEQGHGFCQKHWKRVSCLMKMRIIRYSTPGGEPSSKYQSEIKTAVEAILKREKALK